jgi:hypothetical protein
MPSKEGMHRHSRGTIEALALRIRGEFKEMPGLSLTVRQASRLWQIDTDVCQAVLDALVVAKILRRRSDGVYIAQPAAH